MKTMVIKSVLMYGLLIAATQLISAQQAAKPQPTPFDIALTSGNAGPRIHFQTPVYDFGKIKSGDPAKYTFIFTNVGDAVLILTNVQPQCGCTTAGEWSRRVEPG